ncbi:hypothetical protein N7490_005431 [Penicillium lividum]|nr:hypothetical protein N7490_005431 [Penicillium lividum]
MDSNSVSLPSNLSPSPSPSDGPSAVYGDIGIMGEQKPPKDFTQTWTPARSLGYFAHDRYGLLSLVSLATNTGIRIEGLGDNTHIQIRATTEWQIQEAMEKLNKLAVVMNLTDAPHHVSMVVAAQSPSLRYRIRDLTVTRLAIQRVLLDAATPLGEILAMQALVTYHYNTRTNSWNLLNQLCKPPALQTATNCPETIQAWKDFRYPETESSNVYSDLSPTVFSPQRPTKTDAGSEHHPYLGDFEAKEVGQWVNESQSTTSGTTVTISSSGLLLTSMDGAPESEPSSGEKSEEKMEPRKPRGIKKRITKVTKAEYEKRKADIAAQSVNSTPGTKSIISTSPTHSETPSSYTPSVAFPPAEPVGSKLAFMSRTPFNTPEIPEKVDKKLST